MSEHIQTVDVAIIGYGPSGATLANLLAECGISIAVLERESAMYHLPRAVHFDGETMRVFQAAGIAEELSQKVRVNPGMRFVDKDQILLLDWPRPQEIGPQGWHTSYRLHQPDLETLLRNRLRKREDVHIQTGTRVTEITQNAQSVTLTCENTTSGNAPKLTAKYVVGCDGANSFVRAHIGSDLEDLGFEERWLVLDLLLKRERPDLGDHSIQFCSSTRPMTYCRNPENRRRWEIRMYDSETDHDVTKDARIWEFLAPWLTPEDAQIERSAVYTFRSAIAKKWRAGRVLIAGDACHLTPPFMGQGMCAGIRDVSNLAWKLALSVKGLAKGDLLDSYQTERSANVRSFIETAVRLGGLINAQDPEKALKQASKTQQGSAKMSTIAPSLGAFDLSSLGIGTSSHQGALFPQPILQDGALMDDLIGYSPVLVSRTPIGSESAAKVPVLDAETHPELTKALDEFDVHALLIRPDRYIAASAKTKDASQKLAQTGLPCPRSSPVA